MEYQEPYENDKANKKVAGAKYKIVTMCRGGQIRSVGAKYILHYKYGHDVIACGYESNTQETREMLYDWADYIIIMSKDFEQYVPDKYKTNSSGARKLYLYEVGEDRYGNPFHPELQWQLDKIINKHGLFNQ